MSAPVKIFGPFDIIYNRLVFRYLSNSPTPNDKKCIEQLLRNLQVKGINDTKVLHLSKRVKQIVSCNHIITIHFRRLGAPKVREIQLAWSPNR